MKKKFSIPKGTTNKKKFNIGLILKGLVLAYLFSLVCFLILSIVLSFSNIPESMIKPASYIITIVGIVISSGYVAQRVNKNGWLYGAMTGLLYIIILTLIGIFTGGQLIFNQVLLSRIVIGIVAGSIGGILGINLQ